MTGHLLNHFLFSSPRLTHRFKVGVFSFCAAAILATFWWFKGVSFGIDGPIEEHWGLGWRKSWNIYSA